MVVSVNPTLPVVAAQSVGGARNGLVLQPGTVVSAQVQAVLADDLVQIAIANLSFSVLSEVALTPGQNLQLAVSQTGDGVVRLQIVGQGANAATSTATNNPTILAPGTPTAPVNPAANVVADDPLTPLERIAVSVASETAATQQQSLAPLFANLTAAASTGNFPQALQQAITQVLAQQTSLDENLGGSDIQNAFENSGLFLEASLAAGTVAPAGSTPDLKAALIVLRQTLASAVETIESPAAVASAAATASAAGTKPATDTPTLVPSAPDEAEILSTPGETESLLPSQIAATLEEAAATDPGKLVIAQALLNAGPQAVTSGALLNLVQEALLEIPQAAGNTPAAPTVPQGQGQGQGQGAPAAPSTNTPPPPFRGALPSAQPVATSSLPADASPAAAAHHLLDDTDAALARQTLLQVASLPDPCRADPSIPRWNFEIPFTTPQGTAMAQFEISRDGGNEVEAAKRTWQARFSLNVEPAGPVHALVTLVGDRTSVRMWAERPQTAAQLRAGAAELSQQLSQAELLPGDIVIREGAPPQLTPAKAGHFLDRAL
jgi:Flagellar hook-length control protein FliK